MKIKNYSDATVNELFDILKNNTESGKCVIKLQKIHSNLNIPHLKNCIIHDLSNFLNAWFKLVNDTQNIDINTSRTLLSKLLSAEFIESDKYIKNSVNACKKCGTSIPEVNIVVSYMRAVIKAIIMTKRRSLGFDTKGSRFCNTKQD